MKNKSKRKREYKLNYSSAKISSQSRKIIPNKICMICGWDEAFCDRHRLVSRSKGGRYIKSNCVSLCPNCHRLIHLGLIKLKTGKSRQGR